MRDLILKYVLKNAATHSGVAEAKYIVPKIIGERPEFRAKMMEIMPQIKEIVSEVNAMGKDEQLSMLRKVAPELLETHEGRKGLPELPGETSKVVVRLPPGAEKYLHIGHAFSFMINHLYAKRYKGKVWLRFEDTNPEKCEAEFYGAIREDIRWLGIEWDHEKNETDSMELYYEKARKLIRDGNAYVCTCDVDEVRKRRRTRKACGCRSKDEDKNMEVWDRMFSESKQGEAMLRLRGDMNSDDASFRDPMLFRINDTAHCLTGKRYRVWPGYDFANAVEDSECGITHVIRSNEFATALQKHIRELLGYRKQPEYVEYTRYNVIGAVTKGRIIREMIRSGKASGWDDPKLVTVRALKRRGIVPETFERLIYDIGLTKSRTNITWDKINGTNRRIIDPTSKRYFFVPDPVKIRVEGAPSKRLKLELHPDIDMGSRKIATSDVFYVPRDDARGEFRLKDLYNVKMTRHGKARYRGDELRDIPKVQWVTDDNLEVKVLKPDSMVTGLGEKGISRVGGGETVQFERFGFCRKDNGIFVFCHR
jgi:glutamyl-tRNA synthetase